MIKIPHYNTSQFNSIQLEKSRYDEEDLFYKNFSNVSRQNKHYNQSTPTTPFDLSTFVKDLHDHRYSLMQQDTIYEEDSSSLSTIPSSIRQTSNDGSTKIAVEDDDIKDYTKKFVSPTNIKRAASTACHRPSVQFVEPPKTRKSFSMDDIVTEEKKKKKKSIFSSFLSRESKPQGMSRAATVVLKHDMNQLIQPALVNNKRDTKFSQFLSRASSTSRKRNTKIVNMQHTAKRDEIVRRTIIYVQPNSLHSLLKHGGNGVSVSQNPQHYTNDKESLSSSEDSYMEGVELREMKDGTVTWGVVKKQGNRRSFYARYDDHQFEFLEEELLSPPPVPKRSPQRSVQDDDIYYSKNLTLPRLVKFINDQNPMSVDDQLDEMIQIIKSQQLAAIY